MNFSGPNGSNGGGGVSFSFSGINGANGANGANGGSNTNSGDLIPDSHYDWVFVAHTGDRYAGFMYHDTGAYVPGQVLPTAYGHYQIGAERPYGYDLGPAHGIGEGTVYVTSYHDAVQGDLQTANYPSYSAPSSLSGLGYERGYAWNGALWDDFGYGGAYQAGYFG